MSHISERTSHNKNVPPKVQAQLRRVQEAGQRYARAEQVLREGTITEVALRESGDAYKEWVKSRTEQ